MRFRYKAWTLALMGGLFASLASSVFAESVLRREIGTTDFQYNPHFLNSVYGRDVITDLFEGLMAQDQDGNLILGLTKDWQLSPDGKIYTFTLRNDAKWSDGTPVVAKDFVNAWRRALNPQKTAPLSFLLFPITNAQAISKGEKPADTLGAVALDDHTIRITLDNPTPHFLTLLAQPIYMPSPSQEVARYGADWALPEHLVTDGPFVLASKKPGSNPIVLEKSKTYWDRDEVHLDKVEYYSFPTPKDALQSYINGKIDWTSDIPGDQYSWVKKNYWRDLHVAPSMGSTFYGFNESKPPFSDRRLRAALSLVVNRYQIINCCAIGGGIPAFGVVVQGLPHYHTYLPVWASWPPEKKIETAKRLYAEAGYNSKNPLKITLLYNMGANHKKMAEQVAKIWHDTLGIQVKLVGTTWDKFMRARRDGKTEVFRSGWTGDYPDANAYLELYTSNSLLNDVSFKNPQFDALINKARTEQNPEERAHLLQSAEKILIDNFAVMPLYFHTNRHLIKPYVQGYSLNPDNKSPSRFMYIDHKE